MSYARDRMKETEIRIKYKGEWHTFIRPEAKARNIIEQLSDSTIRKTNGFHEIVETIESPKIKTTPKKVTVAELVEFIKFRPKYIHIAEEISMHFFGKIFTYANERKEFNIIHRKLRQARKEISKKEGVTWKGKRESFGSSICYSIIERGGKTKEDS